MNAAPPPLHRFYLHYSELPYSLRVLYTCALLVLALRIHENRYAA